MTSRSVLLVLIPFVAACATRASAPIAAPSAVVVDSTLFELDGERITRADVALIDKAAIESISTLSGDAAQLRFGRDSRHAVLITSRKERRSTSPSDAAPLFIVDGRTVSTALFNVMDPKAIESIDVIKGAAAAERYGERARDGVILITSKATR